MALRNAVVLRNIIVAIDIYIYICAIESMDLHGTRPLGVNWYRLLSIYSDLLLAESPTHMKNYATLEPSCKVSEQIDVVTAIHGINTELDDLINANKFDLSSDDLTRLKDDIVSGLKDHFQSSGEQCAAPVVCNGESVFLTEGVKNMLADLVRQKAEGSLSPGGQGISEALGRIVGYLEDRPSAAGLEAIEKKLQDLQDTISQQGGVLATEIASKVCSDESSRFTDDVNEVLKTLVEQKAEALNPMTKLSISQLR